MKALLLRRAPLYNLFQDGVPPSGTGVNLTYRVAITLGLTGLFLMTGTAAAQEGPAFDCRKAGREVELIICKDPALAALDRKVAAIYAAAQAKATAQGKAASDMLKTEQRGWVKGRNACWTADDKRLCIQEDYVWRIAELQATFDLVPGTAPVRFTCAGNPAGDITIRFFQTEPASALAQRGDQTSLMLAAPSGSGARYEGRNESFWEHQGVARVTWGDAAREETCRPAS